MSLLIGGFSATAHKWNSWCFSGNGATCDEHEGVNDIDELYSSGSAAVVEFLNAELSYNCN